MTLTPDQKSSVRRRRAGHAFGGTRTGQAINFRVFSFQMACQFDGLGTPSDEDIRDHINNSGSSGDETVRPRGSA